MTKNTAARIAELAAIVQAAIDCAVECGDEETAHELSVILADIMATRDTCVTPTSKPARRTPQRGH